MSSPRYVSDLSCDELKNEILESLERYEKYTGILNPQVDHVALLQHIINCQVQIISKKGNYKDIQKDLTEVITCISSFYNKELQLKSRDFMKAVINRMDGNTNVYTFIFEKQQKFLNIIKSSNEIRNEPINSRGDVERALQLHVRETEDMEYALNKTISYKNNTNMDLEKIFSIQKKVKRGNGFVTDSTAIRNCVSHSLYEITDTSVIFDNHEKGFDYHQEFTYKELQDFLGLKDKFYGLLFSLIDLLYLGHLVKIFFQKCRKI